ncbi:MAG: hypothetical protein P8186_25495 [Anaerolineae bacterium]|jgi:hypothetical protein
MRGVLERRAETTFARLSQAGKNAARQLFLRLVTLSEGVGTDGLPVPDTRRVLDTELEAVMLSSEMPSPDSGSREGYSAAVITEALDAFRKARLLYFDRDASAHSPTADLSSMSLSLRTENV